MNVHGSRIRLFSLSSNRLLAKQIAENLKLPRRQGSSLHLQRRGNFHFSGGIGARLRCVSRPIHLCSGQ